MVGQDSAKGLTGRPRVILVLVGLSLCLIAVRLWSLQVANADKYQQKGLRNRIRNVVVAPRRGCIYDRNSSLLVGNTLRYDASVSYSDMEKSKKGRATLVGVLQRVLAISESQFNRKLDPRRAVTYLPIKIQPGITEQQFYQLKSVEPDVPGLLAEIEASRHYVEGSLAAHLFGAVGAISSETLAMYRKWGYAQDDIVGITGLERIFERELHGVKGLLKVQVDHRNRLDKVIQETKPTPGKSLYLTIDRRLQRAAEDVLVGKKGAIVALDPQNGDVLVLASSPTFDPNVYSLPRSDEDAETIRAWGNDPEKPLHNRAVSGAYLLGSAFKPIVGLAALEAKAISRNTQFYCPGAFSLPGSGRSWGCYHNNSHGDVALEEALKRSCNVYFYNLGRLLGGDAICSMSRKFHLGVKTGICLPLESGGIVPDKDWRQSSDARAEPYRQWFAGNTINLSIGQGPLEATPLQTACAYAAIANGGTYFYPRLVFKITRSPQDTLFPVRSEPLGIGESSLRAIKEGLRRAAQEPGGTAYRVFEDASFLKVAGKTGTAQYGPENQYSYAWFAAYAPCDDPRIVVVVLVEEGKTGGETAAPLARQVLMEFFAMGG
jgi:penicillin-binding protein 2